MSCQRLFPWWFVFPLTITWHQSYPYVYVAFTPCWKDSLLRGLWAFKTSDNSGRLYERGLKGLYEDLKLMFMDKITLYPLNLTLADKMRSCLLGFHILLYYEANFYTNSSFAVVIRTSNTCNFALIWPQLYRKHNQVRDVRASIIKWEFCCFYHVDTAMNVFFFGKVMCLDIFGVLHVCFSFSPHTGALSRNGLITDATMSPLCTSNIPVCIYVPVSVWYEQGEEQEVGGSLVLAGVEEQLQHWGIFDQSFTQLVQQEDQLGLHHTAAVCRTDAGDQSTS